MAQTTKTGIGDFAAIAVPSTGPLYASDTSAAALAVAIVDASGGQIGTAANPLITSGGSGASSQQVQGAAANSSVTTVNPVDVSGVYMATQPTLTDMQRYVEQLDTRGNLRVTLMGANSTNAVTVANSVGDGSAVTNAVRVASANTGWNGSTWDRLYTVQGASAGTGLGVQAATSVPTSSANQAITPVVGSAVTSLVVKASAGNFFGGSMASGATAGYLILYNATAAPAGGASLTAALVLAAIPVAANSWVSIGGTAYPDRCSVGAVLLFSTSTTTYTVPANAALHMRGQAV